MKWYRQNSNYYFQLWKVSTSWNALLLSLFAASQLFIARHKHIFSVVHVHRFHFHHRAFFKYTTRSGPRHPFIPLPSPSHQYPSPSTHPPVCSTAFGAHWARFVQHKHPWSLPRCIQRPCGGWTFSPRDLLTTRVFDGMPQPELASTNIIRGLNVLKFKAGGPRVRCRVLDPHDSIM